MSTETTVEKIEELIEVPETFPKMDKEKVLEGTTMKVRELQEFYDGFSAKSLAAILNPIPKIWYRALPDGTMATDENAHKVTQSMMTVFLSCTAPRSRIPAAAAALIRDFNAITANWNVTSVLIPLSTLELANPQIVDRDWYELFKKIAPEKVKDKPKPVVAPYDKHAIFLMFHAPGPHLPEIKAFSRFTTEEGAVGRDLLDVELEEDRERGRMGA